MPGWQRCALVVLTVILLRGFSTTVAQELPDVRQLIQEIARNEEILQNMTVKFDVTNLPENTKFVEDAQWGFSNGREFMSAVFHVTDSQTGESYEKPLTVTFDGEKMRLFTIDPIHHEPSGRISSLEPDSFTGQPTPNTLLGHDVNGSGRLSMAEGLRDAREVSVRPQKEVIDGHECYVIEAIDIDKANPGRRADVLLWIDPERDYRLLRMEKYKNLTVEKYPSLPEEVFRWKQLQRRVDKVKLQQIEGVWIPVEGERTSFYTIEKPKRGLTEDDVLRMPPEQAVRNIEWEPEPMAPARLIKLDPASVSFGKEIPADKFSIEWPLGTLLWDDFAQIGFTVGTSGEMVSAVSEEDVALSRDLEIIGDTATPETRSNSPTVTAYASSWSGWLAAAVMFVVAASCLAALLWRSRRLRRSAKQSP